MSKKSAKKRQPVVKPAVQEAMSAAVPLGYEEMLTELEVRFIGHNLDDLLVGLLH